jgi:hypothetical protein
MGSRRPVNSGVMRLALGREKQMVSQSKYHTEPDADWPFDQTPSAAAISSRQVIELGYPVLFVTHYEDDHSWSFLCGTTDNYPEDGRVIGMAEALGLDRTLAAVADLPPGWSARRETKDAEWTRYPETAA